MFYTSDVIAETDGRLMHFTQLPNKSSKDYNEAFWNKGLSNTKLYDWYVFNWFNWKPFRVHSSKQDSLLQFRKESGRAQLGTPLNIADKLANRVT